MSDWTQLRMTINDYRAQCPPGRVLVLLDERDALAARLASHEYTPTPEERQKQEALAKKIAAEVLADEAELKQLRADNTRLRAELAQYENVIIPSWKREEEMWRQDEANAVEFRRVLADELDKRDATIAQLRAWLRDYQPHTEHKDGP